MYGNISSIDSDENCIQTISPPKKWSKRKYLPVIEERIILNTYKWGTEIDPGW